MQKTVENECATISLAKTQRPNFVHPFILTYRSLNWLAIYSISCNL